MLEVALFFWVLMNNVVGSLYFSQRLFCDVGVVTLLFCFPSFSMGTPLFSLIMYQSSAKTSIEETEVKLIVGSLVNIWLMDKSSLHLNKILLIVIKWIYF